MEVVSQVDRRKACDLCFIKKIKCDMLTPACSNCQLYKAECRTTAVRRRVKAPKPRPVASDSAATADSSPPTGQEEGRVDAVESRLARIEEQLQQVLAVASAALSQHASGATDSSQSHSPPSNSSQSGSGHTPADFNPARGSPPPPPPQRPVLSASDDSWRDTEAADAVYESSDPKLPPLEAILPAVEDFFTHVNSLLPLFSQPAFMRMLHEYYSSTSQHPRAAWAAVNIVLALGTRLPTTPSNEIDLEADGKRAAKYVQNAQSVLSELVTRDEDLLGLQVLLGLVIVFNSLKDTRPATVIIGTAVRLAHRLQLHNRERQAHYSPEEAVERNRLFWITYLLDKDISLRHQTPALQADADIDLELPLENPPDDAGNIYTKDGRVRANYFRMRLQLSHIQGRIYDLLLSTRAVKMSQREHYARIARLGSQLERWRLGLPRELQAAFILDHLGRTGLYWMAMMHFTYLSCLVTINGVWSQNVEWRQRISTYSSAAINDSGTPACSKLPPPLPKSWEHCVEMSRHCLNLLYRMPMSDTNMWANSCAYFSGTIILLANRCEFPESGDVDADKKLTDYALIVLDKINLVTSQVHVQRLKVVAHELDRRSMLAVEAAKRAARGGTGPTAAAGAGLQFPEFQNALHDSGGVRWDWEDDGVDSWPELDASLENATHELFSVSAESGEMGSGPFVDWSDTQGSQGYGELSF